MKNLKRFAGILALLAIGHLIAGCATITANNNAIAMSQKEMLLTQFGFRARTVSTPGQQQQVSQLPANKVSAVKYQGKLYYVYPTTKKDQVLVGNQAQFDAYKGGLQASRASLPGDQRAQMPAGDALRVEETAGPGQVTVESFDSFGSLNPPPGN